MYASIPAKPLSAKRHKGNAERYRVIIRKTNPAKPWPWPLRCTVNKSQRTIHVVNLSTALHWVNLVKAYAPDVTYSLDGKYAGQWVAVE